MARRRLLLVDPSSESREPLAERLRRLGYVVETARDGVEGAHAALADPPRAVIADLSMPSISGAQLARLLRAEPATADVPVIVRGPEGRKHHFWAEQTGAFAYVVKGRTGDLVRALARCQPRDETEGFFTALASDESDVRDRIAAYLDAALFESVVAAEVRRLAASDSFERLFDLFVQFLSQVTTYRWLALLTESPRRLGLHTRTSHRQRSLDEALAALGVSEPRLFVVEDDDAADAPLADAPHPLVRPIRFGDQTIGTLVLAPAQDIPSDETLVDIVANELGGAVRMATLVEESQRLATIDPLTGLSNRRAFIAAAQRELDRASRHQDAACFLVLDIDHFKSINDTFGHAMGDRALESMGRLLSQRARSSDLVARWGGEEFVVLLASTDAAGGRVAAERLREAIQALEVHTPEGQRIPITASIGLASLRFGEALDAFVDRADRAMYVAKVSGRNRVVEAGSGQSGEHTVPEVVAHAAHDTAAHDTAAHDTAAHDTAAHDTAARDTAHDGASNDTATSGVPAATAPSEDAA